jgi:hypothetical protein
VSIFPQGEQPLDRVVGDAFSSPGQPPGSAFSSTLGGEQALKCQDAFCPDRII